MSTRKGHDIRSRLADSVSQARGERYLRFISTMAAMSSADGPLGPGLQRCDEEEKRRRYFRSTNALWNLISVAGLISTPSFGIRRGVTNSVVRPSTKRSNVVRFGARFLDRLLIRS